MGQQPNLQNIDREIRRLVYVLNEIPYVQTTASCSGHPDDPNRYWWPNGFISLRPADDDICAFREFLEGLRVKLNGIDPQMLKFAQQLDAQDLYTSEEPLVEIGNFSIKLIVKSPDVNRTRQEHSRMWNLVEVAVLQLEPHLKQVSLPSECQPLTLEERAKKTKRESRRREEKRQRLYERVRPMIQEILARRDIENQETLESEILSYLFKNLHHFRPERISFKTWVSRVTLNLVAKYQKRKEGINHNERSRIRITIQEE